MAETQPPGHGLCPSLLLHPPWNVRGQGSLSAFVWRQKAGGAWCLASLIFLILLWVSAPGHEPAKKLAVHPSPWRYMGTRLLYENGGAHCIRLPLEVGGWQYRFSPSFPFSKLYPCPGSSLPNPSKQKQSDRLGRVVRDSMCGYHPFHFLLAFPGSAF